MSELKVFARHEVLGEEIRIYGTLANPLFLAKDVAQWLGHNCTSRMVQSADKMEKVLAITSTLGGLQEMWFLTEEGLYEVLIQSRKPRAKDFKREIREIMSAIRGHSMDITPPSIDQLEQLLADPCTMATVLKAYQEERDERRALEAQWKRDKPFADFAREIAANSDAILIDEFATLANDNGIEICCERLLCWLRDTGYFTEDNRPRQCYVDRGMFVVAKGSVMTVLGEMTQSTTLVTGEGQIVLLDALQRAFVVAG